MKQVIVMRKDLNMRKGKMIAQGAHASLKVTLDNMDNEYTKEWLNGLFKKICVYVNSKEELLQIYNNAAFNVSLPSALIEDSGLTEFGGVSTYTCCAIGPGPDDVIDRYTGELPLL